MIFKVYRWHLMLGLEKKIAFKIIKSRLLEKVLAKKDNALQRAFIENLSQ
jgi:hypothetical protein